MRAEPKVIYFAGPLFTQAERQWNQDVAVALRRRGFTVLLPQEQAAEYFDKQSDGFNPERDAPALFSLSVESITKADLVVAVFDGSDPDSGTSFECGVAWKHGKPIVGV